MMAVSPMAGLDEFVAKLQSLAANTAPKAAKAGLNAGLAVLAKAERTAINGSSASPRMKRAARLTIGKRLVKASYGKQIIAGKAGFAVGKRSKKKQAKATARAGDKTHRGVGIYASDIHWPALGTKEREAGLAHGEGGRLHKTSKAYQEVHGTHPTGRMPAVLAGVIKQAASSAAPAMLAAAAAKIRQVLAADAAKKKG